MAWIIKIKNKVLNRLAVYNRSLLRLIFGFNRWHVRPLRKKVYAQKIIQYCNKQLYRNSFVEIGCGLGDIIRNVKYVHRFGLDLDSKVLQAATFLSRFCRKKIFFLTYNFPDNFNICDNGKFDCILLVNWIHNIQPAILKATIEKYFIENLNDNGIIIFDTVQDKGYKYNHNITSITSDIQCTIEKICEDAPRTVWSIRREDEEGKTRKKHSGDGFHHSRDFFYLSGVF